jgi:hypothetical protein
MALLFPRSDAPISLEKRHLPGWPSRDGDDMNIFGSRGGNETPEFGPREGAPAFSEIGAVVVAGVVLGLAFLILS